MDNNESLLLNGIFRDRKKKNGPETFDKQNDVARELILWKTTKETELNDIYENIIIISKSEKSGSVESAKL